jgi:hypothetical protein
VPVYFRKDAVIQDVMGHALAGAHLYVCEQPANLTIIPPAPLTQVWSDPDGRNGVIPFPLIADGTGHFAYYAQSDFYTEVYFWRGQLYKVLPDQAVGCVCGEGTGGGDGPVPWTFGIPTSMSIGAPNPGTPVMLYTAFAQSVFPPNFVNPTSYGACRNMPIAPRVYTVQVNETTVGTVSVDTNGIFTFTTPGFVINPGQMLMMMPPDPPDPMMADVAITLVSTRLA